MIVEMYHLRISTLYALDVDIWTRVDGILQPDLSNGFRVDCYASDIEAVHVY